MRRTELKKQRKKRRNRRILFSALAVFLVVIGFGSYLIYQTLQAANNSYDDLDGREKSELRDEAVSISSDPFSILIMGVEDYESEGQTGRTDTLMVVTFDPEEQSSKILSIPRDTLVDFVGMDRRDKINHAYAYGEKEMTINTVEGFLDIPIDYYASVNFDAFIEMVDVLGGVTVNVPFDFEQKTMAPNSYYVEFFEGEQHVNGEEALAYVRMRKEDPRGDLGRVDRQQEFMKALADEAMSFQTVTKVDDISKVIGDHVTTNVKVSEGIPMFRNLNNFDRDNMETVELDTYHEMIDGVSFQIARDESLENARSELKEHLQLEDSTHVEHDADVITSEDEEANNSY
ncbi:LCP family protein [Halalkalibacillus halophilus]|uniref:LCP family protein n=1 Tax=Halalkalibacillus halophilus TaxID=392827 RepID=UPI000408E3C0|nr:LCP family protein [Halalkalibacillus halophilus]